eukprot:3958771-Alexandrium_andersonii.AAC.1
MLSTTCTLSAAASTAMSACLWTGRSLPCARRVASRRARATAERRGAPQSFCLECRVLRG